MSTSTEAQALELVDLGSYPIDRPERTEYAALASRCREQLTTTGASILRGFLRPAALHRAIEGTEALIPEAHHSEIGNGSPYLELPHDQADALLLVVAVWVSWDATDPEAVFANNREATHTALMRGVSGEPSLSEVLAARGSPENPYFSPSVDT